MATKKPATSKTSPKPASKATPKLPAKVAPKKRAPRKKATPKGTQGSAAPKKRNPRQRNVELMADACPAWAEGLDPKHRRFLEHYVTNGFNGRKAWVDSDGPPKAARQSAWELLTRPYIKAALKALLQEIHMTTDELRAMVADDARASMDDFLVVDDEGNATLDLTAASQNGALRHIKKLTVETTRDGGQKLQVELVDRQRARDSLAKLMGAHTQRVEITGKDGASLVPELPSADDLKREMQGVVDDLYSRLLTGLRDGD